ncbi:hypothetical protein [Paenibacillus harenae]|uniref:hypothetical protein n=1 Tax=Paenibacillus harenae TaxID=306543 RepID=UPI0027D8B3E2|nr:hypothetical protein [Paenibacillus harenae]
MYNPLIQNYGHIKAVEQQLADFPNIIYISMISLTMRCRFSIDPELRKIGSDELIVYDVELTEFIERKLTRVKAENPSPRFTDDVRSIKERLAALNISDPIVRAQHIERAKASKSSSK